MTVARISDAVMTPMAGTSLELAVDDDGPDGVAERHDDGGGHGRAGRSKWMSRPTSSATPAKPSPSPNMPARLEPLVTELRHDHRGEQRHDGDEQTGGGAVEPRFRMP